jgi:ABC-type glycerol-3-phosphate transport system substrate-binding protein
MIKLETMVMRIISAALAALLVVAAAGSIPAQAATSLFATEPAASAACGADEVVWIDLDRGKFYHKASAAFAKGNNGGYACMKAARAQYREAHE